VANGLLAELRHLLDSARLCFLGMLPTFTGSSHGVNQSSEAKKASFLFSAIAFCTLNFETQAKCNHDERERNPMSNSASDYNNRPTLTSVEAQPDTDTAIAAFVSELQQAWDQRDAGISNRHFAADVAWGSPYGATVNGYNQLHAIHTRLKQQGTGGAASRYEIKRAFAVSDDVIIAHVARYTLDPEGHPIEPSSNTLGAFSEMALYVLVRRDGTWWLAAGQNTPIRQGGAI
jgi:uncharacterized protein (TIGR02246 family)